jgi:hypothetical protein
VQFANIALNQAEGSRTTNEKAADRDCDHGKDDKTGAHGVSNAKVVGKEGAPGTGVPRFIR